MNTTEAVARAEQIATEVADKCHAPRKPGQAPVRYAIIWQAARKGAIAAYEARRGLSPLERELLGALADMTALYVSLVKSGDAGYWNADVVREVIAAYIAIAKAKAVEEMK